VPSRDGKGGTAGLQAEVGALVSQSWARQTNCRSALADLPPLRAGQGSPTAFTRSSAWKPRRKRWKAGDSQRSSIPTRAASSSHSTWRPGHRLRRPRSAGRT